MIIIISSGPGKNGNELALDTPKGSRSVVHHEMQFSVIL